MTFNIIVHGMSHARGLLKYVSPCVIQCATLVLLSLNQPQFNRIGDGNSGVDAQT